MLYDIGGLDNKCTSIVSNDICDRCVCACVNCVQCEWLGKAESNREIRGKRQRNARCRGLIAKTVYRTGTSVLCIRYNVIYSRL